MAYLYLLFAILAEVIATSSLKASEEFTNRGPTLLMFISYGVSFYFLTLTLRDLPVGVAYAIWSGLGIVLITIAAMYIYGEKPDAGALLGIALIVAGVVVLKGFSNMSVRSETEQSQTRPDAKISTSRSTSPTSKSSERNL